MAFFSGGNLNKKIVLTYISIWIKAISYRRKHINRLEIILYLSYVVVNKIKNQCLLAELLMQNILYIIILLSNQLSQIIILIYI